MGRLHHRDHPQRVEPGNIRARKHLRVLDPETHVPPLRAPQRHRLIVHIKDERIGPVADGMRANLKTRVERLFRRCQQFRQDYTWAHGWETPARINLGRELSRLKVNS